MPVSIAPIETTRSFSVQPAKGLRYGNFEGVVYLPPLSTTPRLGEHSFSTLNNQQIYKTVGDWFEGWRPWQQRVLLCGIVDRCSLRQVDILATTLEPIKHRDYTVAVKHHYPTTPLKKTRDDTSKKKRKKKKLRRKKVSEKDLHGQDITISSEHTIEDFLNEEGAETPESVITNIPNFVTREGEKLLEDKLNRLKQQRQKHDQRLRKQFEKSLGKVKSDKTDNDEISAEDHRISLVGSIETIDDFAGALAEKIVDDTLSFPYTEQDSTDLYAQNLASAILTQAIENVADIMTEKEKLMQQQALDSNTLETDTNNIADSNTQEHGNLSNSSIRQKYTETQDIVKIKETVSGNDMHDQETTVKDVGEESLTLKLPVKQVDFRSPVPDTREKSTEREPTTTRKPGITEKSERPTSIVKIQSPREQSDTKGTNTKPINSAHSGTSRVSALTKSSISKMRYDLFGSNMAVKTPDFFKKNGISKYGDMQRELRQGEVFRPARLQNIPVPVTRIYKSVKWWPENPGEGKIFFKAHHTELDVNFREQLQQVWNWMELWEDYEKIALLKELLKLCGAENLGFLTSHIQQHLRDARDINRLSDKLLLYIFSFLAADEIKVISKVCRRWRFLCAKDDLWMIKCHELGLEEGIRNLEMMILQSNSRKMGIDWRLAYEELRRITQMMKLARQKRKKKKKRIKGKEVDFKDELGQLKRTVTDDNSDSDINLCDSLAPEDSDEGLSDSSLESFHPRFEFKNQVRANAEIPDSMLSREQLQTILKKIVFGQPEVELSVHRGTVSAIRRQELPDVDTASLVSEDLREYDEEYSIKKEELPERRKARFRRSLTRVTPTPREQPLSRSETRFDKLRKSNTGPVPLRASLHQQRHLMHDDADVDDAAYDVRPELVPAEDLLGKTVPHRKLEWQREEPKEEVIDDEAPYGDGREPNFAGFVKSVLRGRKLQGHMAGILCVQFDQRRLISAGLDRVIRLWDIRSGRSLHKFYGHKGGIRCLQFIGNDLITGSWDTTIMVWDLRNLCRKFTLPDHKDSVSCLQFNKDYLVSGSHDMTVRVYRRISYLCCQVIRGHTAPITGLAFDGSHVVSASFDTTLRLSNIFTGECVRVFQGNTEPIITVTMKGSLIISGDPMGRLQFWNKTTGDCEAAIQAHTEAVHKVVFLDGRFYTASGDGTIREWDLVTMTSVRVLHGHKGPVRDIKVSHDRIVSCSDDGSIRIWDLFDPRKKSSMAMQIRQIRHDKDNYTMV